MSILKGPTRIIGALSAAIVVVVAFSFGCGTPVEPKPVAATHLDPVGSTTIAAVAGQILTGLAVTVKDQGNQGMSGVAVTFSADAGTVAPSSVQTDLGGQAAIATWTLPTTAGTAHLNANVSVAALPAAQFTATIAAGPASQVVISPATSNNQSTIAGSAVTVPPSVKVTDQYGNGVQNASVAFAIASGGGSTTVPTSVTDANGIAHVGSWTLGPTVGSNTLTATVTGSGITGNPITFTANGTSGPPSKLVVAPGTPTSQAQTAIAGTQVAVAPSVAVSDANGNPVSGAVVIMKIASGAGKVLSSASTLADSLEFTTNASGIASAFGWKLGALGANSLAISVKGTTVTALSLTATGIAGNPKTIAVVTETPSSQAQTAIATQPLAVAPGVVVQDSLGNVVSGASVTFTVTGGGGKVLLTPTDAGATTNAFTTNASGIARTGGWKMGNPGAATMTAALTANAAITVTFTATATTGPPTSIAIVTETPSSNNQSTIANTAVAVAPGVVVKDGGGFGVAGASVQFQIATGAGTVTGAGTTGTTATVTTDATGVARLTNWKPGTVGSNSLTATVTGITPALSVNFAATGTVGPPAAIVKTNTPWAFVKTSTVVGGSPTVTVTDVAGNLVNNATVIWTGGTGSTVTGTSSSSTNASGVATFAGTWTSGTTLGATTLIATVSGISPALTTTFTSKVVGPATQVAVVNGGTAQSAAIGTTVATTPSVIVKDANGDPVPNSTVTYAIASGGGTISWVAQNSGAITKVTTLSVQTDSVGVATQGIQTSPCPDQTCIIGWTLGTVIGANTLTATVTGTGITNNPITFTATATPGPPASIAVNSGNNSTSLVNGNVSISVIVKDASGNAVPSANVSFTPTAGTNATATSPVSTNSSGIATTTWRLDTIAGTNALTAAVVGTSLTASFSATGLATTAAKLVKQAGDGQTGVVGVALATAPAVKVTDSYNNPVSASSVTFTAGTGSGSIAGSPATSNSSGISTAGAWTLGATVGTQTLTAALTSSPSVSVQFSATTTCNDRNYTLGTPVNGNLLAADCTVTNGESGTAAYNGFLFTIPASSQSAFSLSYTSAAFAPELQSFILLPATNYWYLAEASPLTSNYVLGPGSYRLNTTTSTGGATGAYTLSTTLNPALPSGCGFFIVTKGITVNHSLDNNCQYTSTDAAHQNTATSRNSRVYNIVVKANTSITVHMSSSATCAANSSTSPPCELIEINDLNGAFLASDQGTGVVTYTAGSSDIGVSIRATHRLLTGVGLQTGAYTLIIDP